MELFHGSNTVIEKPDLLFSRVSLDFGAGFYTTTNKKQATTFSKKVVERSKKGKETVNVYDFIYDSTELKIREFEKPNAAWLDFVLANRLGSGAEDEFDLVIGPVANDDVYRTLGAFEDGDITKEEALNRLKIKDLFNQYVFKTERALEYLKFIRGEGKDGK
jgi:hypothetical protein